MVFHHSTCTLSMATEFYETVNNDVHVHMSVLRVTSGRVKEKASQLFISAHLPTYVVSLIGISAL